MQNELFEKIGLNKTNNELSEKEHEEVYKELSYYDTIYNTEGLLTSLLYNNLTLEELINTIEELEKEQNIKELI